MFQAIQALALIHECKNISFRLTLRKNFGVLKCSVHHVAFPGSAIIVPAANNQTGGCAAATMLALLGRCSGPAS